MAINMYLHLFPFICFSSKNYSCAPMPVFLNLFFYYSPSKEFFLNFFSNHLLHKMLIPHLYCISVHALWSFGRPRTIVVSKIVLLPPSRN